MVEKNRVFITRSNPVAPDPRVEKIARALNQEGAPVMIIAWDRSAKLPQHDQFENIPVHRLLIQAAYGNGIGNLPALIRWQMGLMSCLARRRNEFDVIHACDFDTILPALVCKLFWRKKVIYDIFDFYADHLRRTPALLKQIIRKLDYWAINQADGVILVDDSRKQQIAGSRPKRLVCVYNSPEDVYDRYICEKNPHAATDGVHVSLRIAYVGLLQVERGIFEMIHVLACHPDWHFDLAGFGGDEGQIVGLIESMPNVVWHGRVNYERALELSAASDVLFATYDPSIANHRFSSANKVFEGMMLGKPIIVAHGTNMDQIIEHADCGVIVQYGNEAELESALELLAANPSLRAQKGHNARQAYQAIYSWENMRIRLKDMYRQILQEK